MLYANHSSHADTHARFAYSFNRKVLQLRLAPPTSTSHLDGSLALLNVNALDFEISSKRSVAPVGRERTGSIRRLTELRRNAYCVLW